MVLIYLSTNWHQSALLDSCDGDTPVLRLYILLERDSTFTACHIDLKANCSYKTTNQIEKMVLTVAYFQKNVHLTNKLSIKVG